MNEVSPHHSRRRAHSKSQFLGRFYRYKLLLIEKWWILVLGVAVGTVGGAGVWWFGPPSFTSEGRMIVAVQLKIPESSAYSEEIGSFLGTQVELMRSSLVMSRAQARLAAQDSNAIPCRVTLKVTVLPKSQIFVLRATGEDREYTRQILQACMDEYKAVKIEQRTSSSDTTALGLTEEISRLDKQLRESQAELSAFLSTNSIDVTQEQGNNSVANSLIDLHQQLARYKSEYALLQTLTLDQDIARRQKVVETVGTQGDADKSASAAGSTTDSEYQKAKQEILVLEAQQAEFAQVLKPKHPRMIAMSDEIARRRKLLEILQKQSADQMETRKSTLQRLIANLEEDIKGWDAKALDLNRRRQDYLGLKANLQRIQALYDHLDTALKTLDLGTQISPDPVMSMQPASEAMADQQDLVWHLLMGALAGVVVGIAVLMLLDRMDDRMTSFSELQELFDEEVLGQIPREKSRADHKEPGLIEMEDERHAFVEAYRNLRSSLLYMSEGGQRPKTLAVTSSVPNDGKSLTAANLAIIMASSGSQVLLVDADLRKGGLHHRLDLPPEPGLCEVLADGVSWAQTVRATKIPGLSLLPRGRSSQRSSELFISKVTEEFLKDAATKYDYVIVDTAPVMAADDVTSLAPHIDGVIFVIRAEHSSGRVARAALDLLYQRQAKVLGLVFNAVHPKSSDYYYYYKYEDYYRSYPSTHGGGKRKRTHKGDDGDAS
jgi:polysaccharide biosynthesis transport protein